MPGKKSEFLLQGAAEEVPRLNFPLVWTDIEENIGGSIGIETSRNAPDFFGHWRFFKQHFEDIQVKKKLFSPGIEHQPLWGRSQTIWMNF